MEEKARLIWMNEAFYSTRPDARLGLLKEWLDMARYGNTALRGVLTRPEFFAPEKGDRKAYFRRCRAYPPAPQLADWFCRKLLNCRVWEWVSGKAPEPETGEVIYANPPPAYVVADLVAV